TLADLNRRLAPTSLRVELASPAELEALDGVTGVEALGEGAFRIHHEADTSPAETLASQAVTADWGLRALIPEEASLEQIFVDLTLKDTDEQEAA
ncbi:MAG: hypothetical protein ABEK42_00035, partial [Thiohalorhabdaceae bacterium]